MGYKVVGLDNLSTGKIDNISEFIDNFNFKFIEDDIRNLDTCMKACKDIEYVVHHARWGGQYQDQ